jgi:predicted amidohydrolase YtcJ
VAEVDPARLRAPSVKLFQDGVMESATAALLEPYLGPIALDAGPDGRGVSIHDPDVLRTMCVALDAERFAVHAHAIGDRAVREVLDALTAARRANGPRDARHQIAHLQLVDPEDLPRFRALGVIANCQPYWAFEDGYLRDLTRPILGDERVDRMYPFGSLARLGATLAFGSDWSVSTPDPLRLIAVATRRVDPDEPSDTQLGPPAERLSLDAALRAATRGAAIANTFDDLDGTIETGRAADLVLLDGDMDVTPGAPAGRGVLMTMVDGIPVWEAPELDA